MPVKKQHQIPKKKQLKATLKKKKIKKNEKILLIIKNY